MKLQINVQTDKQPIVIELFSDSEEVLRQIDSESAETNAEAVFQIAEGSTIEYVITKGHQFEKKANIVKHSRAHGSSGTISPGNYVGTLSLSVILKDSGQVVSKLSIEVFSVKSDYRSDYRRMLEEIAEKCSELVMMHDSPVSQAFGSDFSEDSKTLYQRFVFIRSIVGSDDFSEAINRIISSPSVRWASYEKQEDIRKLPKIDSKMLRQITSSKARMSMPLDFVKETGIETMPCKVVIDDKRESYDTPENRFIKHVLETYMFTISVIREKMSKNSRERKEAENLEEDLKVVLSHSFFREVQPPSFLAINSPVLQRREGYREVLRGWLMFDLASKLVWQGGEDVYNAGKRDVAVLYEYWLFFKLLEAVSKVFNVEHKALKDMIKQTSNGLCLQLQSGKHTVISGISDTGTRKLHIKFSYNRTFSKSDFPKGGSWTKNMRPDYTLSIWPVGFKEQEAEEQENIVHVHFDAKYRVEEIKKMFDKSGNSEDEDLDNEKKEEKQGIYKRADLLKMHAYKDAVRRTVGAYILYPGDKDYRDKGFHEIIPGLGAFSIKPSSSDTGVASLIEFIKEVKDNFSNRASQMERSSYHTYDIHKDIDTDKVNENLPEKIGLERTKPISEVQVLVGYVQDKQVDWIKKHKLYNTRMNGNIGASEAGAMYILLRGRPDADGNEITGDLWKVSGEKPEIWTKQQLIDEGYPNPSKEEYFVYYLESAEDEFSDMKWDVSKLNKFNKNSYYPFSVVLNELMTACVR